MTLAFTLNRNVSVIQTFAGAGQACLHLTARQFSRFHPEPADPLPSV